MWLSCQPQYVELVVMSTCNWYAFVTNVRHAFIAPRTSCLACLQTYGRRRVAPGRARHHGGDRTFWARIRSFVSSRRSWQGRDAPAGVGDDDGLGQKPSLSP